MKRRSFDQSDQIRLNLQYLDRAENLQAAQAHRLFAEVPMLPLCVSLIIGIILAADPAPETVGRVVCTAVLLAGILLIAGYCRTAPVHQLFLTCTAAALLCACLGAGRLAAIRYCPPCHISHILVQDRQLATLRGRIVSPVRRNDTNRGFGTIPWLGSQSSFYLSVEAVRTPTGWESACGRVRVQVNEPVQKARAGHRIQLYCTLSPFSGPPNPGQFDLRNWMNSRGVYLAASAPIEDSIEVTDTQRAFLPALRRRLYQYSADALLDETAVDPDVRSLVSALLLGRRGSLNPSVLAAFQQTNLSHFISLSGMHVGILAGSLWVLLRTAQIPKRPRAILCIILILTYALIVPPRAPTMRAVFLSCFFFGSALLHRRVHPLNTLALSAVVLLLIRPYELFSPGWQLSFLSVFSIILLYHPVRYRLLTYLFYPAVKLLKGRLVLLQHVLYGALELLSVGVAIWIVIAPVLLYYFGQINPLSPLWTVLVFPAVLLILYAGFLKIALAGLLPTAAAALGAFLNLLAHVLEKMVVLLAKVDFLRITSARPSLPLIVILYLLLAAVYFLPPTWFRWRRLTATALVGCFLLPWMMRLNSIRSDTLEITCLSVGHGQAAILSTPTGEHLLFDAGSITHQDIARKVIAPYLQHRRIFALDAVYISHGDLDHLNAMPDLTAAVPARKICGNRVLLENARTPSLEKTFKDQLARTGRTIDPVRREQYGPVRIRSLWPPNDAVADGLSENDRSEVVLIEYANRRFLLCGDIERPAQQRFLESHPDLHVDVMLLPHHGSTTNLDTRFIDRLSPSILIASCASRNQPSAYRPSPGSSTCCFYTARDGAVTVKIKADGTCSATGFLTSHE